jgi:hypothetical protein
MGKPEGADQGTHLVNTRFDSTADTAKRRGFPALFAGAGRLHRSERQEHMDRTFYNE